ncbi:FecR family protein [Zobellia nedashkovskayae]|uniref:FecR family protein n=1 Tax=Zobellia nedashkovskayae TaxID=2779510 RepID=UPI00188DA8D9|nr:FecR domain-containing protein [Zobellia nedashkovskayae]
MRYNNYTEENFIADEYFQKWVLGSDEMCDNFWSNWLEDYPHKLETVKKARTLVLLLNTEESKLPEKDFDAMWRNIVERRANESNLAINQRNSKKGIILKVAAVFVGIMVTTLAVYYANTNLASTTAAPAQITLELEDGTLKILDEEAFGAVTNANGNLVVQQQQNLLNYAENDAPNQKLVYNQLTVPYGKKFQLQLSDGSHVFLNSGSKLRYPVNFIEGMPRNVYLDGEAYFSVEKDTERPFTVVTHDMDTRVLGTEFNVSSYMNENNTSTVLVEGSVVVFKSDENEMTELVKIKPGERAVFENDEIGVSTVSIDKYIAWKEDKLLFEDDQFYLILNELERNFNVTIENKYVALGDKRFTGSFDGETLEQILKICSEHTPFDYAINADKITITKNQESLN